MENCFEIFGFSSSTLGAFLIDSLVLLATFWVAGFSYFVAMINIDNN
jgi:hypothetical protein